MLYTQDVQLESERLECRILAIVSTALFLESYIYDYGSRRESSRFVDKYIDKMDPVAKWVIVPRLLASPGIPQDDEFFGRVRGLFRLRNELVHHKTKATEGPDDREALLEEFNPKACVALVEDLLRKLQKVDPMDDFAGFVVRHLESWTDYASKDSSFYPILWNA